MRLAQPTIEGIEAHAYRIPTDAPEADGTYAWDATTMVIAEVTAGGHRGVGYTYAGKASAQIIDNVLAPAICHHDAFAIPWLWKAMIGAVRNLGWQGVCSNAIAAVDVALWDLKARILGIPLVQLFGAARYEVPIYGSGGFTTYSLERLSSQLGRWAQDDGCQWVKMKVGSQPECDFERVRVVRAAIGDADLMVDANGAFDRKQALLFAEKAAMIGVVWFEEPVSSDDLDGLRLIRDKALNGLEIAAGEYGYDLFYFKRMMDQGAVDVLQADATRCCGYTGFLAVASLADAQPLPLSAHTAPRCSPPAPSGMVSRPCSHRANAV
jgi:L-alanine-DL-glutamate epimerase-like enolase superfamily enzyme